jgi:hypothetical protein
VGKVFLIRWLFLNINEVFSRQHTREIQKFYFTLQEDSDEGDQGV